MHVGVKVVGRVAFFPPLSLLPPRMEYGDFPGGREAKTLRIPVQEARVQPLTSELDPTCHSESSPMPYLGPGKKNGI